MSPPAPPSPPPSPGGGSSSIIWGTVIAVAGIIVAAVALSFTQFVWFFILTATLCLSVGVFLFMRKFTLGAGAYVSIAPLLLLAILLGAGVSLYVSQIREKPKPDALVAPRLQIVAPAPGELMRRSRCLLVQFKATPMSNDVAYIVGSRVKGDGQRPWFFDSKITSDAATGELSAEVHLGVSGLTDANKEFDLKIIALDARVVHYLANVAAPKTFWSSEDLPPNPLQVASSTVHRDGEAGCP